MKNKYNNIDKQNKTDLLSFISNGVYPYIIIIITGIVIYANSVSYDFLNFDDKPIVENLQSISKTINFFDCFKMDPYFNPSGEFYRPLLSITFFVDYYFSKLNPIGYHITNLSLHILTCIFIFYLLLSFDLNRISSMLFTIIFLVHPLFNFTVIWAPSRNDILIALFGIISFIFLDKFYKKTNWINFIAHIFFYLLAMFSKESAITFPLIFIIRYYLTYYLKQSVNILNIKNIALIIGWAFVISIYFFLRSIVVTVPFIPISQIFNIFLSNLQAIPEFVAKFFIPFNLTGITVYSLITTLIGLLILLIVLAGLFYSKRKVNKTEIIGLFWFIFPTAIQLFYRHSFGNQAYDYLDNRMYFPAIGMLIVIISYFQFIKKIQKLNYLLVFLICLFSLYSILNCRNFENPLAFYNHVIESGSKKALIYYNRGICKFEANDLNGALQDYNKAIELKTDYESAYFSRGVIKNDNNSYYDAMNDYNKTLELNPHNLKAINNLGVVCLNLKDFKRALGYFQKVAALDPTYGLAQRNIGIVYYNLHNLIEACRAWNQAVTLGDEDSGKLLGRYCK